MRFLGIDFRSTREVVRHDEDYKQLRVSFDALNKTLLTKSEYGWRTPEGLGERPNADQRTLQNDLGSQQPIFPFPLARCYVMTKEVDALRIPIEVLNREIFRNGFAVVPRWAYMCKKCKKEYQEKPEIPAVDADSEEMECDVCSGKEFRKPNPENRQILVKLLKHKVNDNKQTLKQVCRQVEKDLEIADFGIMLLIKRYEKTADGKFRNAVLDEIIRASPAYAYCVANTEGRFGYDYKNQRIYFCPQHRSKRVAVAGTEIPKCQECGYECLRAYLEINAVSQGNIAESPKRILYGLDEAIVCHGKYWPDLLYGYSPVFSVWSKVLSLQFQDEYVRKYFDKMRPPRAMLVIGSRNYNTLQKAFDNMKDAAKQDPFTLQPLMVETERGGRNMVQYVNFTDTLEDLQFIQVRDEYRRSIGAMYGVTGLFEGDVNEGWSQEGLKLAVTNRAVEWGHTVLNESFLEPLCLQYGVDDWVIEMKQGEEIDEMRDEDLEGRKIANAQMLQGMGFGVERTAEGKFVFTQKPVTEPEGGAVNDKIHRDDMGTSFDGDPKPPRPSDNGGAGDGTPASGSNTSLSKR